MAERGARILAAVRDLEELALARGEVLSGSAPARHHPVGGAVPAAAAARRGRGRYPELRLSVRETITATLVEELVDGDLDAIVASLPLDTDELEELAAFEDRLPARRAGRIAACRARRRRWPS